MSPPSRSAKQNSGYAWPDLIRHRHRNDAFTTAIYDADRIYICIYIHLSLSAYQLRTARLRRPCRAYICLPIMASTLNLSLTFVPITLLLRFCPIKASPPRPCPTWKQRVTPNLLYPRLTPKSLVLAQASQQLELAPASSGGMASPTSPSLNGGNRQVALGWRTTTLVSIFAYIPQSLARK